MDIKVPGFTRFSRFGVNLGRLHPVAAIHTEDLNGTDELQITCLDDLNKNDYIVWQDRDGKWHEHIVNTVKRGHDSAGQSLTLANCINSIAETWDDYVEDKRPSGTVTTALNSILETSRWVSGTSTQAGTASHVFYHKSVRECINELLQTWGGELETQLTCTAAGVTQRKVVVSAQRGNQDSAKRFTWTKDIVSITRDVLDENPKSRIYAYGKGVETESGGYGRRLTISGVNGGKPYVEDTAATRLFGHPMPDGTTAPACGVYINDQCEDANQLLAEARAALADAIVPKVSYTADVIDLVAFGRTWEGVGLGDVVAIIDTEFSDEGLRLKGRVSRLERDLMTYDTKVTFGTLYDALTSPWKSLQTRVASLSQRAANWDLAGTASTGWLDTLMASMNSAFDAAGTYKFSSFEQGDIWSSVPLDENGHATTSGGWAININGHGLRLASSLNADGTWNWRAFGTGEGFVADEIVSGILRSAGNESYFNLETGEVLISSGSTLGDRTVDTTLNTLDTASGNATQALSDAADAAKVATDFLVFSPSTGLDVGFSTTNAKTRVTPDGVEVFDGDGTSIAFFGKSGSYVINRLGKATGGGKVICSSDGSVEVGYGSTIGAHFGYGTVRDVNTTTNGTYLTIGTRDSSYDIGHRSATFGLNNAASYSNAFAAGNSSKALNVCCFAMGAAAKAEHNYSFAGGYQTSTGAAYQLIHGQNLLGGTTSGGVVLGRFNTQTTGALIVGQGTSTSSRKNIFNLSTAGNLTINGTLTQSSDRRLKHHIAYLGDDAAEFVRGLKPVLYEKDGTKQVGFYAQDVEEVEPWQAGIVGRTDGMDERLPDLRTLDYTALIAPLVAYTQQLEAKLDALTARLEEVLSGA